MTFIGSGEKKSLIYRLNIIFSIYNSCGPVNGVKNQLVLPEGYL